MSLKTHLLTLKDAWARETERRKAAHKVREETDFLPAAVAILEKPPSPIGRGILWLIIIAALFALIWSFLSQIETVAVAPGKIAPQGRLRSVEVAEPSIVKALHVREGQHVMAGALMVEFDPALVSADLNAAKAQYQATSEANTRAGALLGQGGAGQLDGANQSLYYAQVNQYQQQRASLTQRLEGAKADLRAQDAEITRLEQTVPLAKQRLDSMRELEAKGFGAKLRTLQAEEDYINQTQSLATARARREQALAQVADIDHSIRELDAQFRVKAASENAQFEAQSRVSEAEVNKAEARYDRLSMRAPVSGTVHEVFINTIGQVAEPAKPLITLIPDGETLIVEAMVLNKDIGFVRKGQKVVIKLDAYPFTRYGYLEGVVETILPDSIADEHLGLVYPVRVRLNAKQGRMKIKDWKLSPGMAANVEIVTGQRRVIDFILSPIAKSTQEAGRER